MQFVGHKQIFFYFPNIINNIHHFVAPDPCPRRATLESRMMIDLHNTGAATLRTLRGKPTPGANAQSISPAARYYDSADWWQLRAAIMKALQDFPEARDSVVRALRDLNALQDPDASTSS